MTTNELVPQPAASPLEILFKRKATTFDLSLRSNAISFDSFLGAIISAGARDPKLLKCVQTDPVSVLSCASIAATLGLLPGEALGEFYLIPRSNSVKRGDAWTKVLQCTFIIGYQGMLKLVHQHPKVELVQPVLVYKDEEFDYMPAAMEPVRHRAPFGIDRKPETVVGGYCLGWLRGSRRPVCVVLDLADFEAARIRNVKKTDDGKEKTNAWTTDYEAMCLKTLVRRICKILPKSSRLQLAIEKEDRQDADPETIGRIRLVDEPTGGVDALEAGLPNGQSIEGGDSEDPAPAPQSAKTDAGSNGSFFASARSEDEGGSDG